MYIANIHWYKVNFMIVIGLYYNLHSARRCLSMKSKDGVRQAAQNMIASPWQYETVFYISWWAGLSVGAHCEAADTCAVQRCVLYCTPVHRRHFGPQRRSVVAELSR